MSAERKVLCASALFAAGALWLACFLPAFGKKEAPARELRSEVRETTPAAPVFETAAGAWNSAATKTPWSSELKALRELAAIDPDTAFVRIAAMSDKHERRSAATNVCQLVAAADPAKAMEAAWNLGLGQFSDSLEEVLALETVARRWAEKDPTRALAWAGKLPADEESRRDYVLRGICTALAEECPDMAAELVTGSMAPESSVQLDAALEVLKSWARRDFDGALKWADGFPKGSLRARRLEELTDRVIGRAEAGKAGN